MMRTKTFFIGFTFLLLAAMSVFFLPGVFLTHAQMAASAGTLGSQLILPVQGGTLAVSGALDKSSYAPGETITATVTIEWKVSGGASVALGALAAVDPPTPPLSLPGRSDTSEFAGFFIPKVRSVFTPPGSGDPSPAKVAIKEPVARSTTVTKSVQFTAPSGVGAHKIVGWGGYVLNAGGTFGSGFIDYGDYFTLPFIVEMRSSSPPPPTGGGIVCQPAAGSESGGFKGNLPLEGSAQTAPLQTGQVFTLECWNTVDPAGTKVRESVTALVPPPAFGALDLFSLTNSGDITVMQGGVSSNTIAVVKGKDEYKGLVYLSTTTDLKIEKAEVSLAPPSARAGTTSTFSVGTSGATPPGAYPVTVIGKTPPVLGGSCTTSHDANRGGNFIDCTSTLRAASLQLSASGVSFPGTFAFYGTFADAVCGANNWTASRASSAVRLGENGGTGSFSCTDLAKTQIARTTAFKVTVTALPPGETPAVSPSAGKQWDGWLKLSGKAQDGSPYGVKYDPKTTRLCGYAWGGEVMGWVEFGPLTTSNLNDGVCSRSASTPYRWVKLEGTIGGEIGTSMSELATIPPTSTVAYDNTWKNNTYHLVGWAWSSNIGWIHMAEKPLGTCGKDAVVCMAVGDDIGDKVNGRALKGYAWSEHIGWVKFDHTPPNSRMFSLDEDFPIDPSDPPRESNGAGRLVISENLLKGWARVCAATLGGNCATATGEYQGPKR